MRTEKWEVEAGYKMNKKKMSLKKRRGIYSTIQQSNVALSTDTPFSELKGKEKGEKAKGNPASDKLQWP